MNATSPALPFHDDAARRAALAARDPSADGHFVYSVRTTGVYCRPSCAARPARAENVAFHATPTEAERAGFRACRRCRPDEPPRRERDAERIARACREIERSEDAPRLAELATLVGMSPHHFHRTFRRVTGVTPRSYADAERQRRLRRELGGGSAVTTALYAAGYGSSSRFYEAADATLGMTATRYRAGGAGETIRFATAASALGRVLVAAADRGVCAILLGDDARALEADLRARFPRATLVGTDRAFARSIGAVVRFVESPSADFPLPLDVRGTAFQRRVWEALRRIPAGRTASYAEVAKRIGRPGAARAVARACAANPLAIAVPCHRIVAANGGLAGYRWGVERKRRLLERERA